MRKCYNFKLKWVKHSSWILWMSWTQKLEVDYCQLTRIAQVGSLTKTSHFQAAPFSSCVRCAAVASSPECCCPWETVTMQPNLKSLSWSLKLGTPLLFHATTTSALLTPLLPLQVTSPQRVGPSLTELLHP